MKLVFDLDGTLVRTREANLEAYRSLGVNPPQDFDIRPWQEWCSPEDHERKLAVYPRFVKMMATLLPTYRLLEASGGTILTNCNRKSLDAVVAVFPKLGSYACLFEHTPDMKLNLLRRAKPGVYFDDSPNMVRRVREETSWQAIDTSGF